MKTFSSLLDSTLHQSFLNRQDEALIEFVSDRVEYGKYLTRCISAFDNYQYIEHEYPIKSFTSERTHFRDIGFSLWHRSLDRTCYTLDLDFLEMRKENCLWQPKMIYDIKRGRFDIDRLKEWNNDYLSHLTAYKSFADALDIPFAVISYKPDLSHFTLYHIEDAPPNLKYRTVHLNEPAMREFIESL
jgi:predicted transcriptional regulator of viral defense system